MTHLATFLAAIALGIIAGRRILHWVDAQVDRAVREALAFEADDWDEHVAEAVALTETPIYTELAREQFVADALAEIEELTGGVA